MKQENIKGWYWILCAWPNSGWYLWLC